MQEITDLQATALNPPKPHSTIGMRTVVHNLLPITQFTSYHPDPNINFQLNRFLIPGLEKLFAGIGAKIKDFDDWKSQFLTVAYEYEQRGDLGRAARLFRAAEFFMSSDDPDRRRAADKFIELFYRANDNQLLQRIEIPYEAGHLHGLRLGAVTASRGTILIHAGFDAYVEEFYAFAQAIALCGYEVVMFDGPGQGSTLMREKIPMKHEWEKPVGAVLDHLALTDVTLIGISLGGYLAVRAAAFEPRIKRVVAFDVMLDFFQCVTSRRGAIAEFAINALVRLRLGTPLNMMARGLMKWDLYSRWGIQQGMHVTGAASPSEYFFKLKAYNSREVSQRVTQDTDHGWRRGPFRAPQTVLRPASFVDQRKVGYRSTLHAGRSSAITLPGGQPGAGAHADSQLGGNSFLTPSDSPELAKARTRQDSFFRHPDG